MAGRTPSRRPTSKRPEGDGPNQSGTEKVTSGFLGFWTTIPGLITAVAALLTALVGVVGLVYTINTGRVPGVGGIVQSTSSAAGPVATQSASPGNVKSLNATCLMQLFKGIPTERVVQLTVSSYITLSPRVTDLHELSGEYGVVFLDQEHRANGALRLTYNADRRAYQVNRVLDSSCSVVTFAGLPTLSAGENQEIQMKIGGLSFSMFITLINSQLYLYAI